MTDLAAGGWDCHVHVFDQSAPVRGGHYRPANHTLGQIEARAAAHGVRHLVLVQPSVYGTDNSVMLGALAQRPGRHRGVAVLAEGVAEAELQAMHAAGVRGARLNMVSPVGEGPQVAQRFAALEPCLRRMGWHLQWYTDAERLAQVAELHRSSRIPCVLDHLAGLGAQVPDDHPAWPAVQRLAEGGAWLKLSGWYRLGARAPYAELVPRIRRLAAWFGERLLWGSDWPHTLFPPEAMPAYAETWQPVVQALGEHAALALRTRRPALYA